MDKKLLEAGAVYGNRIPNKYFMNTGFGQTDLGSGIDPWETGSYDLALLDAGIENFNVIQYTSVLPPEAVEVPFAEAEPLIHHGSVLEAIMANLNGRQGDRLCAGVGRIHVRKKSDGVVIGGFAAEYEGHAQTDQAREILHGSLMGIFERRYSDDQYECFDEQFTIRDEVVAKKWGTIIAVMGFVSYIYPAVE